MKRYIKSAKQFYDNQGNVISLDRETRSLTYEYSFDGDYYKGSYHILVRFYDPSTKARCYISKINDFNIVDESNPYNLVKGKSYQVSGYFYPETSLATNEISYQILNPRIQGIKGSDGKEVVLTFTYPSDAVEEANRLCEIFDDNNIEYKCYDIESGYPIQFKVCRSGRNWNDIMKLINSVKAARYRQQKMFVDRTENTLRFRDI